MDDNEFILGHFWAARADSSGASPPLLILRPVIATGSGGVPQPDCIIELDSCEGCGVNEGLAVAKDGQTVVGVGHREGCTWLTETLNDPDRDWYLAAPEEAGGIPAGPDSATLISAHMHGTGARERIFTAVRSREAVAFIAKMSDCADLNTLPWETLPGVRAAACGLIASQNAPLVVVKIGYTEDGETWASWYPPVPQPPVPATS